MSRSYHLAKQSIAGYHSSNRMGPFISIALFVGFGAVFVLAGLLASSFVRPSSTNPEKAATYECGETTIGSSWVQFDLRFYIVALVYLVFDVEVALFYPWAVAWGSADELAKKLGFASVYEFRKVALVDMLFFFGVLLVGFAYLWRFGYLDWVRSAAATSIKATHQPGTDLSEAARMAE